jgi:N-carbamoylputrescine amidase
MYSSMRDEERQWCRYSEKMYFNVGDTGFKVFNTKFAKLGVAICWDQWFPEAARAMALQGAEVHPF